MENLRSSADGGPVYGDDLDIWTSTPATSIADKFSNLPDGFMFTAHGNTFQAIYEGGDGNDLTLTVVP